MYKRVYCLKINAHVFKRKKCDLFSSPRKFILIRFYTLQYIDVKHNSNIQKKDALIN